MLSAQFSLWNALLLSLLEKWYFDCQSKTHAPKNSPRLCLLASCQVYHRVVCREKPDVYSRGPKAAGILFFFFLPPRVMRFLPILQSFKVPAVLKVLSLFLSLSLCRDDHGFSPLHWACREGRSNVVDMLIMRGARINVMNRGDDTPLHLASSHGHREIVGKVRLSVNTVSCRQKVPSWFLWSSRL